MKQFLFLVLFVYMYGNEGISLGESTRNYFSKNFNSAVKNPLMADTEFKTIDGSKNFKANVSCSDNPRQYINISYSGGSDITINVKIDTDLNGTFDKNFNFSNISGVASNGVAVCNPNSWNECNFFKWKISSNNLFLTNAQLFHLGGLYCINSSCNNLSQTNRQDILNTLGGAISNLYQSANNNLIINQTQNNGVSIIYYAQYNNCTGNVNTPTYSEGMTLNPSVEMANDTLSSYSTLNKSIANQNTQEIDNSFKNETSFITSNSHAEITDKTNYTFSYNTKSKEDGTNWVVNDGTGRINIDFEHPEIKYCEISFLEENTEVMSDGETRHSSIGETDTYKTTIRECTGQNYDICPVDTTREVIKSQCGENDDFAEVTSALFALQEMANDISCSATE